MHNRAHLRTKQARADEDGVSSLKGARSQHALDAMLSAIPALAFDDLAAKTYGPIARALLAAEAARPDDHELWCTRRP
jgi:hypothetical protein